MKTNPTRNRKLRVVARGDTCRAWACVALTAALASSGQAEPQGKKPWRFVGLAVIDVAGGPPRRLVKSLGAECGSPRWSPDGRWVAFDEWTVGRYSGCKVVVVNAQTGARRELGLGMMPSWSPDSTQLAWHVVPQGVAVARADGAGRETIIDHGCSPNWINNGASLLVRSGRGLSTIDLQTGTEQPVVHSLNFMQLAFRASPDGKLVAYTTSQNELVISPLGPPVVQNPLRVLRGPLRYSAWSPDGSQVATTITEPVETVPQIYLLTVDSNDPPKKLKGVPPGLACYSPDWSPDGKQILFSCGPLPGEIEDPEPAN